MDIDPRAMGYCFERNSIAMDYIQDEGHDQHNFSVNFITNININPVPE
jgi:arylamine N-acetyltransferase